MKNNKRLLANSLIEICSHKPLDNVTVTEITKKAGLTRQVFYHHFMDKYELAKWVHMMDYLEHIDTKKESGAVEIGWMDVSYDWLSTIEKHKAFYQNVYHSINEKEFQRLMRNHVYDSYKVTLEYVLGEKISEELNFSLQLYCIGLTEKINDWIKEGMNTSVNQFCKWMFKAMPKEIQEIMIGYKVSRSSLIKVTKFIAHQCEADRKSYMS